VGKTLTGRRWVARKPRWRGEKVEDVYFSPRTSPLAFIKITPEKMDFICKNSTFLYQRACPEPDEGKGVRGMD
jgi:hypothetical protein